MGGRGGWCTGDKPVLKLSPLGRVLYLDYHFKQKPLCWSYYFLYLSKYFFNHYHSFFLVLKHRKSAHFWNVMQYYTRACSHAIWSQSWASGGRRLSFLACNLLWHCFLIELQIKLRGILWLRKSFIFEVSSQSLKRRDSEKTQVTRCDAPLSFYPVANQQTKWIWV